jgi:hypothetical protein
MSLLSRCSPRYSTPSFGGSHTSIWESTNLEGQVSALYVVSYDSQGYGALVHSANKMGLQKKICIWPWLCYLGNASDCSRQIIAGYWIRNNKETSPTGKSGFNKFHISHLGPRCVYRHFSDYYLRRWIVPTMHHPSANTNSAFPIGWFQQSVSPLNRMYALLLVRTKVNHVIFTQAFPHLQATSPRTYSLRSNPYGPY